MRLITGLLCAAAMALLCAGCATEIARVDLNGDGSPDVVRGLNAESHFYYFDYNVVAEFSGPEGTYQRKPLMTFRGRPDQVWFEDADQDGDLDLRCVLNSKSRWDHVVNGNYVSWNNGEGDFGRLELLGDATKPQARPAP